MGAVCDLPQLERTAAAFARIGVTQTRP